MRKVHQLKTKCTLEKKSPKYYQSYGEYIETCKDVLLQYIGRLGYVCLIIHALNILTRRGDVGQYLSCVKYACTYKLTLIRIVFN